MLPHKKTTIDVIIDTLDSYCIMMPNLNSSIVSTNYVTNVELIVKFSSKAQRFVMVSVN